MTSDIIRILNAADHFLTEKSTLRKTAIVFGMSKTSLHKAFTKELAVIDSSKAMEVRKLLDKNKAEAHIRGGIATANKNKNKKV